MNILYAALVACLAVAMPAIAQPQAPRGQVPESPRSLAGDASKPDVKVEPCKPAAKKAAVAKKPYVTAPKTDLTAPAK